MTNQQGVSQTEQANPFYFRVMSFEEMGPCMACGKDHLNTFVRDDVNTNADRPFIGVCPETKKELHVAFTFDQKWSVDLRKRIEWSPSSDSPSQVVSK